MSNYSSFMHNAKKQADVYHISKGLSAMQEVRV